MLKAIVAVTIRFSDSAFMACDDVKMFCLTFSLNSALSRDNVIRPLPGYLRFFSGFQMKRDDCSLSRNL